MRVLILSPDREGVVELRPLNKKKMELMLQKLHVQDLPLKEVSRVYTTLKDVEGMISRDKYKELKNGWDVIVNIDDEVVFSLYGVQ